MLRSVQNSSQKPPWRHQCYSAAPWALLHSHSPQKLHNRASLSDEYGRITDNSVNKCRSKLKWIPIDSNIADLHSAFYSTKRGLRSIRKMTKPSVLSSGGHKEQEAVNDQLYEQIYEADIKQALKETMNGNENKKGEDGTELDEDSLKSSGTINKRRSRRKLLEEKDVVKSSRPSRGMVKKNDLNANKNPDDMDDVEKVSLAEVCIEDVTTSDSGKQLKKRKTSVKASRHVELKSVTGSESKQDANVVVNKEEPWTLLVHKKVQSEWVAYNPTSMRKPDPSFSCLRLLSWNVNGLRALLKGKEPNPIVQLAQREKFDVLCLQETKLQEKDVNAIKETLLPGYENSFWSCSTTKLGYSGTAIISRIKPLSVTYGIGCQDHDFEGRIITLEFDNFYLVTGYIPNSGQKLERLAYRTQSWDLSLSNFLNDLETRKSVVLTGDLNCAHQEIDIYNPDGNRRSAGFTDEERTSFERNFLERGLVDTFRRQHKHVVAYTYWGYRTAARPKNQGWRLDYFLVSHGFLDHVYDSYILPDVGGSDHCPVGLILQA